MKRLYIIKAGSTFPATAGRFGDFDRWTIDGLGKIKAETCVLDAEHGAALPTASDCAGVIITGSHSMVTDDLPWSIGLEAWIPSLLEAHVPFLGICYGHQLLARSMGGQVGFHPRGEEIGTVEICLRDEFVNDALFRLFPKSFAAHVTHSQTVLRLPPDAIPLASNSYEPNHAFRLGDRAWGVQFHPEYNAAVMRDYILEQADELESMGRSVRELLCAVKGTPVALQTLRNFAGIVENGLDNQGEEGLGKE